MFAVQADKGVEEESFNRQDYSTLSRGDSSGGATSISRVGDDKHDVGSISGMTEGPHSKLDESSVLQASFASVSSSKASYRNGVNGTPQRSVINAPTRKIPARTPPRVSSGYGQTPSNLKQYTSPTTRHNKQTLWKLRMENLKSMSESFQDENTHRLRASGL